MYMVDSVRNAGIAAARQPIMIVMEFVPNGALNTFLKHCKQRNMLLSTYELIAICEDASAGPPTVQ